MRHIIFYLFFFITIGFCSLKAQTFKHVEVVSGFGILRNNNGVAVADYDGDRDLDIFVVANGIENQNVPESISRLFRNNNDGTFTDVTVASGLINLLTPDDNTDVTFAQAGHKFGVSWGDINNDGYPEILFTHAFKVQLFLNSGDGTFVDITEDSGIEEFSSCINMGASWFDYNNDGFLDVYISDWRRCQSNSLYKNNGNNTFTNVTVEIGLFENNPSLSYTSFPFDINEDGWMDLIVTNDLHESNYLYLNQNGTSFIEEASAYGLDSKIDDMAIVISDIDFDNDFDFFITGIDENAALINNGTNSFSESSSTLGLSAMGWAWGARFADFDLDGDEDLYVVNGYKFEGRGTEQNRYFENLISDGQNLFQDNSSGVGLADFTISVETLDFDYDNDGDLDLFVTNNDGSSYFYENKILNFDEDSHLKWFKVDLVGTTSNRNAIGTKLELSTTKGNFIRYYSGVGFLSQSLQPVHFGLPNDALIDKLTIRWPSGIVETHAGFEPNTFIEAIEGQGAEILAIAPSQKVYGCTDSESCTYNPQATLDDGSCQYLISNQIIGPGTSGFYKTETYVYSVENDARVIWTISGGEILGGQGSNAVTVRWHIEPSGQITAKEFSANCFSKPVSKDVQLSIQDIPVDKSIARIWNEALLEAIRGDYARPTVHARNLFHASIAMYDAWAIYDETAEPYLIGNDVSGFSSELLDFTPNESIEESKRKAISYAVYTLLSHRFKDSPGAEQTQQRIDLIMEQLGYDTGQAVNANYEGGDAASLGNYIAKTIIDYGKQDGSREGSDYNNAYYKPINASLNPTLKDNSTDINPNRWQPLSLNGFVDQSGNLIDGDIIDFLSPEWGNVHGFALSNREMTTYQRDGDTYQVFHDPSEPPYLSSDKQSMSTEAYKWGFSMVSVWQSHLDPTDGVYWDISPKSLGNIDFNKLPNSYLDYPEFYDFFNGGDISIGRTVNQITGLSYQEQIVPRGDYARVLAEFWADGPASETPPGHWFTILNYVNDNSVFEKRFEGLGETLNPLEWDVKSYFILGGAMHDAAISAWSIKGWYDYIRPISAIRYMTSQGQSTDGSAPNYNPKGIPLIDNYVELINADDPLAGSSGQNINKIKLYTWRGHDFINNTDTDVAGVGWILAENWWPYQRPNFVTPPFAGYVSGHSTYSRAAAEVLTALTGSEFFPGGLGEFIAKKNEFLVFEEGPSVDVKLQWATYRDASDQCSLSRIWGGIHPPADDIPGRIIGEKVGRNAFNFALPYFYGKPSEDNFDKIMIYPNPLVDKELYVSNSLVSDVFQVFDITGRFINIIDKKYDRNKKVTTLILPHYLSSGTYILRTSHVSKLFIIR